MLLSAIALVAALTVVPMRIVHHVPLVQASINGRGPFWFLVDTGTDPSVVDSDLARTLSLALGNAGRISGGGGGRPAEHAVSFAELEVGSLRLRNVPAIAMPLRSISRALGVSLAGVLGHSVLMRRVTQFDYTHLRLRLASSRRALGKLQGSCWHAISFRYDDDVLTRAVTANGVSVTADIDTGSNGFLAITPEAAHRLGLAGSRRAVSSQGYNGRYASESGTIRHLTIGSRTFDDVPTTFWKIGTGHDHKPFDLNVGSRILDSLDPVVDFQNDTLEIRSCHR